MSSIAKILNVNLTTKEITTEILDEKIIKKYPGGSSLGMYLMLKEMDPTIDPLSPENMLIFSVSVLTGYPVSGQSRMNVTAKSPLTGCAGDSQVGGFIPAQLAANGYIAVVFRGKAEKPVYLYIDKEDVQLRDASHMWGKSTGDATDLLEEELEDIKTESSMIGPAGENMVKYASIMHMRNRANGRNGLGAVMGSKNLKALVVRKTAPPKAHDMDEIKKLTLDVKERMKTTAAGISQRGTAPNFDKMGGIGFLPSYNWDTGYMENYEEAGGIKMNELYTQKRDTCFGCAIRCKPEVEIPGKVSPKYGGPEYETVGVFGSYCGNLDLDAICVANQACNKMGLDTVSCGATIAWAMDCYENGILTKEDTDGLELNYGRGDLFEALIEKIAYRKDGLGELLAEGSAAAAKRIGKEAEDLVVATKGQEWPAHTVQLKPNLAIIYSANPFGADHQSCEHDPVLQGAEDSLGWQRASDLGKFKHVDEMNVLDENKAHYTFVTQKFYSAMDTFCLCQFAWGSFWQLYGPKELVIFAKGAVGWDLTIDDILEIGERRIVMMRMFNAKNGIDRKYDVLPKKAYLPITGTDGTVGQVKHNEFVDAMDDYYRIAGWYEDTGIPTGRTLKRLGLEWLM